MHRGSFAWLFHAVGLRYMVKKNWENTSLNEEAYTSVLGQRDVRSGFVAFIIGR